jgi:formylmethanofuran dehydrogenase subunit E
LASTRQKTQISTKTLLRKAEGFHGHLGPFLAIGVRLGQFGLKKLNANGLERSLRVSLSILQKVPYSCIVDGVQISTGCTVGNQKLQLKNSEQIEACFEDLSSGRNVTVALSPMVYGMLKEQIVGKNLPDEEIRKLARTIASMSEKDLFVVRNR